MKLRFEQIAIAECVVETIRHVSEMTEHEETWQWDDERHALTGYQAFQELLVTSKDCLPVTAPGRIFLHVEEYMSKLETTLLNGCLPGGPSEKDPKWQDELHI